MKDPAEKILRVDPAEPMLKKEPTEAMLKADARLSADTKAMTDRKLLIERFEAVVRQKLGISCTSEKIYQSIRTQFSRA